MPWTKSDVDEFNSGLSDSEKERWVEVANSALESCLADGGSQEECEASAIRQANGVVGNTANQEQENYSLQVNNYEITTGDLHGKEHLIVPVIMMREGVHNGSAGPILHKREELQHYTSAWNGIPVVVPHPTEDGKFISANIPEVLEEREIGRVFNAHVEGDKLKAEAWIDEEKAENISPRALQMVKDKEPLDVSVGVFTDNEQNTGQWNNQTYQAVAHNYRPDHLAFLPDEQGACSWGDGCGVRVNRKNEKGGIHKVTYVINENLELDLKKLSKNGVNLIQLNQGYRDLIEKAQNRLDEMDNDFKMHFLAEIYDDEVIYRVDNSQEGEQNFYRQEYDTKEDGEIELTGEPEKVIQKVSYVTANKDVNDNDDELNGNTKGDIMSDKEKTPCEAIQSLIKSDYTAFDEGDEDWLSNLEEPSVNKLVAMEEKVREKDEESNDDEVMTQEKAVQTLKESFKDSEDFLEIVPDEYSEQMKYGLKLHNEKRKDLIDSITANSKAFSEDELEKKDMPELEKLASFVDDTSGMDYSGLAGGEGPQANTGKDDEEPLLPTGVQANQKQNE